MLSTKIRTAIISISAVAAVAASGGQASALIAVRPVTTPAPIAHPTIAAKTKEVGSAGQPGWDNAKCEQHQIVAEQDEREAAAASEKGETKKAETKTALAKSAWTTIGISCLIVD
jgi:hypothetical protein